MLNFLNSIGFQVRDIVGGFALLALGAVLSFAISCSVHWIAFKVRKSPAWYHPGEFRDIAWISVPIAIQFLLAALILAPSDLPWGLGGARLFALCLTLGLIFAAMIPFGVWALWDAWRTSEKPLSEKLGNAVTGIFALIGFSVTLNWVIENGPWWWWLPYIGLVLCLIAAIVWDDARERRGRATATAAAGTATSRRRRPAVGQSQNGIAAQWMESQ